MTIKQKGLRLRYRHERKEARMTAPLFLRIFAALAVVALLGGCQMANEPACVRVGRNS